MEDGFEVLTRLGRLFMMTFITGLTSECGRFEELIESELN